MDILRKTQKDECFLERIQHGETEFPFRFYREDVWDFDFHCIDWHWHPEVEFVYAERGSITCFIGTEQFILPQGCGLFVNSGALHRYQAEESVSVPNIVFSPELLGAKSGRIYRKYVNPIVESELACILFCPSVDWQREILQCLLHIFHLQEGENAEMQTVAYLLELWHELFLHAQVRCGQKTGDRGRRAQLQVMMQFIHANHNRQITLKEIADSVHISESSALQLFRQGIHRSPVAYLIQYRIKRAADLLVNTNKTVTNIAYETGFSDAGYFCRIFRKYYRQTAMEYRKKLRSNQPTIAPIQLEEV